MNGSIYDFENQITDFGLYDVDALMSDQYTVPGIFGKGFLNVGPPDSDNLLPHDITEQPHEARIRLMSTLAPSQFVSGTTGTSTPVSMYQSMVPGKNDNNANNGDFGINGVSVIGGELATCQNEKLRALESELAALRRQMQVLLSGRFQPPLDTEATFYSAATATSSSRSVSPQSQCRAQAPPTRTPLEDDDGRYSGTSSLDEHNVCSGWLGSVPAKSVDGARHGYYSMSLDGMSASMLSQHTSSIVSSLPVAAPPPPPDVQSLRAAKPVLVDNSENVRDKGGLRKSGIRKVTPDSRGPLTDVLKGLNTVKLRHVPNRSPGGTPMRRRSNEHSIGVNHEGDPAAFLAHALRRKFAEVHKCAASPTPSPSVSKSLSGNVDSPNTGTGGASDNELSETNSSAEWGDWSTPPKPVRRCLVQQQNE